MTRIIITCSQSEVLDQSQYTVAMSINAPSRHHSDYLGISLGSVMFSGRNMSSSSSLVSHSFSSTRS